MVSLRAQFAETVTDLGRSKDNLAVVVGDISHGIFSDFREIAPERYFNIGICEPAMASICAGLNKVGINPVVHTIAPFLIERSFEQIKLDFEYQGLSANFVSVGGTFDYSQLGCSHHSYMDVALMRSLPSAKIFMPSSRQEFDEAFRKYYQEPGVKYFRLTENGNELESSFFEEGSFLSNGSDVTVVTAGASVGVVSTACDAAKNCGIEVDLIALTKIWPLDCGHIAKSLEKTKRLLVVSELHKVGGLGDLVRNSINGLQISAYSSLELEDFVREYGSYSELRKVAGLDMEHVFKAIQQIVVD